MKILIVTGEVSGDRYGAELARAIFKRVPSASVVAFGGAALRDAGATVEFETVSIAAIGISERVQFLLRIAAFRRRLAQVLNSDSFDAAIIVDFPHHNGWIARQIARKSIPITTFITPNFWIWDDRKKATELANYSARIVTIFPQEFAFYRTLTDKPVYYFGHPMFPMGHTPAAGVKTPSILVMPGSRNQDVRAHLPTIIAAINLLSPKPEIIMPIAIPELEPMMRQLLEARAHFPFQLIPASEVESRVPDAALIISSTGTSSLLAIKYEKPIIVLGHLSWVSTFIVRHILRLDIPYAALPNILAGKAIVPELKFAERDPKLIAKWIRKFWKTAACPPEFKVLRHQLTQSEDPFAATVQLLLTK